MTKSTAEAAMELLAILGMALLAILTGIQIIESIGFLVGSVIIVVVLALGFKVLDIIDERP